MLTRIFGFLVATFGIFVVYGIGIGSFVGWAYWMWMAIQLGSFMMFLFGLLGPLAFIAALLGLWSIIFGIPLWLLHWVS